MARLLRHGNVHQADAIAFTRSKCSESDSSSLEGRGLGSPRNRPASNYCAPEITWALTFIWRWFATAISGRAEPAGAITPIAYPWLRAATVEFSSSFSVTRGSYSGCGTINSWPPFGAVTLSSIPVSTHLKSAHTALAGAAFPDAFFPDAVFPAAAFPAAAVPAAAVPVLLANGIGMTRPEGGGNAWA